MENKTRFDLNNAVATWKQELIARPGISAEDARELETHLLDTIAELKERGVGDREVFEKARRQIGSIDQLAEEYAKAHPMRTWRERVFWMGFACLALVMWGGVVNGLTILLRSAIPGLDSFAPLLIVVYLILAIVLPIAAVALLAGGRGVFLFRILHWFCAGRIRFVVTTIASLVALQFGTLWIIRHHPIPRGGWENVSSAQILSAFLIPLLLWPGPVIALMAWLLPRRQTPGEFSDESFVSDNRSISRERVFWMVVGVLAINCWKAATIPAWKWSSGVAYGLFPDAEAPFLVLRWTLQILLNCAPVVIAILAVQGRLNRHTARASRWLRNRGRVALAVGTMILAAELIKVSALDYPPDKLWLPLLQGVLWLSGLLACIVWLLPKPIKNHEVTA